MGYVYGGILLRSVYLWWSLHAQNAWARTFLRDDSMRTSLYRSSAAPWALRLGLSLVAAFLFAAIAPPLGAQSDDGAKYAALIKEAKTQAGLIKVHHKDGKVYFELTAGNMNKDLIVAISIARGIAQGQVLAGMTWGFGDDWLWRFRKVDDDIQIVRRNVRFTAKGGSPEEKAVKLAYTDSVLYALPVAAKGPGGSYVIDVTPVFMSDLPQISSVLPGFLFSASRSSWASVKGLEENIELEVEATYA